MLFLIEKVPSKIATVMVSFDAGARSEESYPEGIAHMLEHMIFKGTKKRTYLDISREVAFLGGQINAFTSNELVNFYISVPYEHSEKAMEILSDIVFESTFPDAEFEKEKEVVKEEALASKDDVESYIYDEFCSKFFTERLSMPIIGTTDSISKFTNADVKNFYNQFYKRENAIITFCSNLSKSQSQKMLKKYFGKEDKQFLFSPQKTLSYQPAQDLRLNRPALEHAYVWSCYPGLPSQSPYKAAESVMLSILGKGMNSRLFEEIREKQGLCYSIGAESISFRDCGAVIISSSTRSENIEKIVNSTQEQISRITNELIEDEELIRAKNKYKAFIYASSEKSYNMAYQTLIRKFYGLDSKSLEDEINSVTKEDIMNVAKIIFDDKKRFTVICEGSDK